MLKRLRLHNFRTYLNAEIDFRRCHLLIGKNNSGKSNLCYALRFLGKTASRPLAEAASACVPGGVAEIKHFGFNSDRVDFALTCELPFGKDRLTYEYALSIDITADRHGAIPSQGLRVAQERLAVTGGGFVGSVLLESDGREARLLHEEHAIQSGPPSVATTRAPEGATMLSALYELETNRRAVFFRRFLQNWMYFLLECGSIRFGWGEAARTEGLYVNGKHLADAIFRLKNQDERRYRRLLERVNALDETLQAINFLVSPDQGVVPFVALRARDRASWVGLSDGTLRALALSHLIEVADAGSSMEDSPPTLMIIEEPENGIYVAMLRSLLEGFESCSPNAQFIFTSHSPYVIDLFGRDLASVTWLKREGGVTSSRPLSDFAEKINRYRDDYGHSLGEQHYRELFE